MILTIGGLIQDEAQGAASVPILFVVVETHISYLRFNNMPYQDEHHYQSQQCKYNCPCQHQYKFARRTFESPSPLHSKLLKIKTDSKMLTKNQILSWLCSGLPTYKWLHDEINKLIGPVSWFTVVRYYLSIWRGLTKLWTFESRYKIKLDIAYGQLIHEIYLLDFTFWLKQYLNLDLILLYYIHTFIAFI